MSRREAMAMAGAALLAARVERADAADLPLLRVGVVPIFVVAPHIVAERKGYFAAAGIAVETRMVQGGTVGIPGLVAGSFDILYANSTTVLAALARGIDLRIIAEGTRIPERPPDPAALLQRKGEGLRSGKDLAGKVVGINARYDIQWLIAQLWLKKTGGDPAKTSYREVPLPAMLDALANRQVDTVVAVDPFLTIGLGDPRFELLAWAQSEVMPGLPSSLWVVSGKTAETKGALVHAYLRGFLAGARWVNAHLGDADYRSLVASYTKTDEKLLAKMTVSKQPLVINPGGIERFATLMQENGLLPNMPDIAEKVFAS